MAHCGEVREGGGEKERDRVLQILVEVWNVEWQNAEDQIVGIKL
jgi:hypothetical protein